WFCPSDTKSVVAIINYGYYMKVYLDDERDTPEGWVRSYWPEEVIELLKSGNVTEISLDHDLGDDDHGTGYDVVLWIEEAVITRGFVPPIMKVHSANSSARMKMELGIQNINSKVGR
ncbi:cyclic-phosphate processing receiver domain-containing protein, partial [Vibrio anguillarum]